MLRATKNPSEPIKDPSRIPKHPRESLTPEKSFQNPRGTQRFCASLPAVPLLFRFVTSSIKFLLTYTTQMGPRQCREGGVRGLFGAALTPVHSFGTADDRRLTVVIISYTFLRSLGRGLRVGGGGG